MQFLLLAVFAALLTASFPTLAHVGGELTGLQVAAGFVTWMNILTVFAIVLGVASAGYMLYKWFGWIFELLAEVPAVIYEVLGYGFCVALIALAYQVTEANQVWLLLTGSLMFGVMLLITGAVHKLKANYQRFFGTLFFVWSAVALVFQSGHVGFIAVGAFMGMLGFTAAVIPFGYALGFESKTALSKATSAAFLVLLAFVALRTFGAPVPALQVFEQGALWFGSFVLFLGLLIASSRWYDNQKSYVLMQVVTILMGWTAIMAGSLLDISPLLGVGATFLVLYLIEKPFEIKAKSTTKYAAITLVVAISVGTGVWWAQNNMEVVEPFLLF